MKLLSTLLLISVLSLPATAQQQNTFFGSDVDHGGYGAATARLTSIKNADALLVGGYGGWLIDHRLMLGAGGYGLVNELRARPEAEARYSYDGEPLYLNMGYGGFIMEYTIAPNDLIHFNVQALIGGGAVHYREHWYVGYEHHSNSWDDDEDYGPSDIFFVIEPAANVEFNMTSWFRMDIGASYRHVSGIDVLEGMKNEDLRGLSGNLTLKFGAF
ncbi:hypothetical protein KQI65_14055 [bacterium]|nr:hypothetical protein [bacterium]